MDQRNRHGLPRTGNPMSEVSLNVLRIDGFDTATVATESGQPLQLIRFYSEMDASPWLALSGAQFAELRTELARRERSAMEHDYLRSSE
jgi:hypothetical protein